MPTNNSMHWRHPATINSGEAILIEAGISAYLEHRYDEAVGILSSHAQRDVPEAMYIIGSMLEVGWGGLCANPRKALDLFVSAAKLGCPYADACVLTFFLEQDNIDYGYIPEPNQESKERILDRSKIVADELFSLASTGDVEAAIMLQHIQNETCKDAPYYPQTNEILLTLAMNGSTSSAFYYALSLLLEEADGESFEKFSKAGLGWLGFSTEHGNSQAGSILGMILICSEDENICNYGWDLLFSAARTCCTPAMSLLAQNLEKVATDEETKELAASWYYGAASYGGAKEKYEAALRHDPTSDRCLLKNVDLAQRLYMEAADFGHPSARMILSEAHAATSRLC